MILDSTNCNLLYRRDLAKDWAEAWVTGPNFMAF